MTKGLLDQGEGDLAVGFRSPFYNSSQTESQFWVHLEGLGLITNNDGCLTWAERISVLSHRGGSYMFVNFTLHGQPAQRTKEIRGVAQEASHGTSEGWNMTHSMS